MTRFIDEVKIRVTAGNGGNGCVSFHRAKYVPKGGPDGGDGGRGGSIYLEASKDVHTLLDFRYKPHYRAKNGAKGGGAQCYGRGAEDIVLKVPIGTLVYSEDGELEEDLNAEGMKLLVAKGGKGGLGNIHFKSSTNRAPRMATPGQLGQERHIELELKLMSDIGLVGFPNAGKSTLLSTMTHACPKIADYPFTTLMPHLGVIPDSWPPVTMADIPGIIEGAHTGLGLGLQFLRHISRASHLLFVIAFDSQISLQDTLRVLLQEIETFDSSLLNRPRWVVINKIDLLKDEVDPALKERWNDEWDALKRSFPGIIGISAKHHDGIESLTTKILGEFLKDAPRVVSYS